jgi:hypothetical protein
MPASPLSTDWLNMVATEVADLPSHRVTLSSTANALAMRKLQPGVGTLPYPSRWEPRSPTTPRVEGSGRTVLACPTPSRKHSTNQPGS